MKQNNSLPLWRVVLIAVFSVIGLTCAFILQDDARLIVGYGHGYPTDWKEESQNGKIFDHDSQGHYIRGNWEYVSESRIGNVSNLDSRGYPLENNWVNIGNIYWCLQDFEDVNANEDFGKLIQLYAYDITGWDDPNYGEEASLWIYDISPKLRKTKKSSSKFYKEICDSYTMGANSMWKKTNALNNVLVLKSGPALDISMNTDQTSSSMLVEKFIVLKNNRVYSFHFTNDKIEVKGLNTFETFNKRCLSILKRFDFTSYERWKVRYAKGISLVNKEQKERYYWCRNLFVLSVLSLVLVFFLFFKKLGNLNLFAKRLAIYDVIGFFLAVIALIFASIKELSINTEHLSWYVITFYIHYGLLCSIMYRYLAGKSNLADSNKYSLIPNWLNEASILKSERSKRILLILLLYPLFFVLPLPYIGDLIFIFYILPVAFIFLIIYGIAWIRGGKTSNPKILKESVPEQQNGKVFCRHCGKLIDADSEYCCYCGKKV